MGMRTAAKKMNGLAKTASDKLGDINQVLNDTFNIPCGVIESVDTVVQDAISLILEVLDLFAEGGGGDGCLQSCECLDGEQGGDAVANYIGKLATVGESCAEVWQDGRQFLADIAGAIQDVMWFPSFSLPGWLRDLLDFIGSVAKKIDDILNKKRCIKIIWVKVCGTIQDVLDGLSFLISWAKDIIEGIVMDVINAILKAIGLKSINELIDDILDLIGIPQDFFEQSLQDMLKSLFSQVAETAWNRLTELIDVDNLPFKLPSCGNGRSLNDFRDTDVWCMIDQLRKGIQARAVDALAEMSASYIEDKIDLIQIL